MADVEHSQLPDELLHEPKGASTAAAGTVYVANGAGSGSFSKLPVNSLNIPLESVQLILEPEGTAEVKLNELITALKNEGLIE